VKREIILAAVMLISSRAYTMEYSYRIVGSNSILIDASGDIERDEDVIFATWYTSLPNDVTNHSIDEFIFNSPGGSVLGAVKLSAQIGQFHFNTGVAAGGECTSACILPYVLGQQKSIALDARIGVHEAANEEALEGDTQAQANSIMVTKLMADALAEENVPSSIIYKMLMTPPTSIYWLTADDLAAWNVNIITADAPQTQPAAPQAIEVPRTQPAAPQAIEVPQAHPAAPQAIEVPQTPRKVEYRYMQWACQIAGTNTFYYVTYDRADLSNIQAYVGSKPRPAHFSHLGDSDVIDIDHLRIILSSHPDTDPSQVIHLDENNRQEIIYCSPSKYWS
jgi:hypothetical protein